MPGLDLDRAVEKPLGIGAMHVRRFVALACVAPLVRGDATPYAPFQAVSDGKHVYLFRQSTGGTLYVDRFVFDPAPQTLNPTWEARFQRNRKRDLSASRKDTLGPGIWKANHSSSQPWNCRGRGSARWKPIAS
jgi:hypothetical protein